MLMQAGKWGDTLSRGWCYEHFGMLNQLLENRVPYLRGRPDRIVAACKILAKQLALPTTQQFSLLLAARFQDLGMIGIPDRILMKAEALSAEENDILAKHPDISGRLVAKLFPDFPDAIEAIWYHHERPDGKGIYGVKGDDIPMLASIASVAEAIESMANDRPYRAALKPAEIVEQVRKLLGTQFAETPAEAFLARSAEILEIVRARHDAIPSPEAPQEAVA